MRQLSAAELDVLSRSDYQIYARLTVAGTALDAGGFLGVNPLLSFTLTADLDARVWSATITTSLLSGSQSLSPWLSTGATLSGIPVFALVRTIAIQVQCTLAGTLPAPGGWRKVFEGQIDTVEVSPPTSTVTLHCRDQMAVLLDRQIENITNVVASTGDPGGPKWGFPVDAGLVTAQLQQILADSISYGESFAIVTEPGTTATAFWQERTSVMDALVALGTGKNGYDIRGRWDLPSNGVDSFVLAYYLPDRGGIDFPAAVFGPTRSSTNYPFVAVRSLNLDVVGVRNVAEVTPADAARVPVISTNAASIARYGRKFLAVSEEATSHIDTPTEAADLGAIIVADLGVPKTAVELEVPFLWFLEINDLFLLTPDGFFAGFPPVAYDNFRYFSVTHLELHYKDGAGSTVVAGREATSAASSGFWRLVSTQSKPKLQYTRTTAPVGPAVEGATWSQVADTTVATRA